MMLCRPTACVMPLRGTGGRDETTLLGRNWLELWETPDKRIINPSLAVSSFYAEVLKADLS